MRAKHRWMALPLVCSVLGCATTPALRLDTGSGRTVIHEPPFDVKPVVVDPGEFAEVVSRMLLEMPLSLGSEEGSGRVRVASWRTDKGSPSSLFLDERERRSLALSYALDSVWEGVAVAVKATINPIALKAMVSSALCAYLMLLVAPEPVTKFVAIALATYLIAYVGVGPLWNMVRAFQQLRDESRNASSFAQLEEAGHRFGRVVGDNGARVLIMALLAAAGGRAAMTTRGPMLPSYARAALAAEANGGFSLAAVAAGGVQSITLTASGVVVGLAPSAVAMMAWGKGGDAAPSRPWPGDDPTKPPAEDWEWRGPDAPGGEKGAWVNKNNPRESLHPDFNHGPPGPHWDWNTPDGKRWRIFPGGRVEPK